MATLRVEGGELEGSAVVRQSIRRPAEAAEEVGARDVQQVVLPEVRVEVEGVEEGEARIRALRERDRDRAVEVDDRCRRHPAEVLVESHDAGEVGGGGGRGEG
jgi:hypothetical protein